MQRRLSRRSLLVIGGTSVAILSIGGCVFARADQSGEIVSVSEGQAVLAGPTLATVIPGGTPMSSPEPAVVQAVDESRRALDILRTSGLEFPLLVPQTALGLPFSGVAPQFDDPRLVRVEMLFGEVSVGPSDGQAKDTAISYLQVKSERPVTFAPVPNIQSRRDVSLRGTSANIEIGGPYENAPRGSISLTWRQDNISYHIRTTNLSEDQILRFASLLARIP